MKKVTFTDYLKDIHDEDCQEDDFDMWLEEMDKDELIEHAENWGKILKGEL